MAQDDEPSANVYAYFSALVIIIALAVSWFFEGLESVSYAVIIVVSFVWVLYVDGLQAEKEAGMVHQWFSKETLLLILGWIIIGIIGLLLSFFVFFVALAWFYSNVS